MKLLDMKVQDVALALIVLTVCGAFLGVVFFGVQVDAGLKATVVNLFVAMFAGVPAWITAKREGLKQGEANAMNAMRTAGK